MVHTARGARGARNLPAVSTAGDLLARRGLVKKRRRRRYYQHPGVVPVTTTQPNDLWTADCKGHCRTQRRPRAPAQDPEGRGHAPAALDPHHPAPGYQSTVRLSLLGSALAPDFVTEGRGVIFGGTPGRGKTHLAVAIAYRAIQNGFDALFATAAELIDDLSAAFRLGRLADTLDRYVHPAVLVVDEVGYLTYGTDAANMLFHVVHDRHRKKRAMVFTTNRPLTGWGRVLHDEDLAHAIVDRILERGRLLTLDGPSIRTKHLGLDDPTAHLASTQSASLSAEGARISRIQTPEFPEPTSRSALTTQRAVGCMPC